MPGARVCIITYSGVTQDDLPRQRDLGPFLQRTMPR